MGKIVPSYGWHWDNRCLLQSFFFFFFVLQHLPQVGYLLVLELWLESTVSSLSCGAPREADGAFPQNMVIKADFWIFIPSTMFVCFLQSIWLPSEAWPILLRHITLSHNLQYKLT